MAKNGDHYWVFAHVTPSFAGGAGDKITGFHSNRRSPERSAIAKIEPIYRQLVEEENQFENRKDGMNAGFETLCGLLESQGVSYDQFVFSL